MWTSIRGGLFAICCMWVMSHSFAGDDRNHNRPLKGMYQGIATINCLESQGGFTPELLFQLNGFAGKYTDTLMSTATFHGDGTMTESIRGTTYFQGDPYFPGALSAGTFVGNCAYTLSMNANKSFTLTGSCRSTLPLGPAAGQEAIVDGIIAHGQVSEDDSVIIVGSPEPQAQTITLLPSGYVAQRLCGGTATYIRVR